MDGHRLGVRLSPPTLGAHTDELLATMGYTNSDVQELRRNKSVA